LGKPVELTAEELALLVEALQDAAFYRDAGSHVLRSAVRKREGAPDGRDHHRAKARAYQALALRLKSSS